MGESAVGDMGISAREMLRRTEQRLRVAGLGGARHEAEWLVSAALRVSRTDLYVDHEALAPEALDRLETWILQRLQGVPLQHVVGWTEFCGHRLAVNPSVLIPRPETECVVEAVIERLRRRAAVRHPIQILELGTGSGAIAIALAHAIPPCVVIAVELSWDALRTASANIQRHDVANRVRVVCADWADSIRGSFDVIVSNPPYVPTGELSGLPEDVRREPRMSLDGGADGMAFHRRTIAAAQRLLEPGGWLACECDERQADALTRAVRVALPIGEMTILVDLAGRPRGVVAVRAVAEAST